MHIPTAPRSAVKSQIFFFAFLLAVFAFSSWEHYNAGLGYDTDAATISDRARTGSAGRQFALVALGGFSAYILATKSRYRVRVNGLLGAAFLFYICWVILSITWSIDPVLTTKAAVRFTLMCGGALAVAKMMPFRQIILLTFYMCLVTLIVSVLYECYLGMFAPLDEAWRLSGVMHPVSQGWNCSLLCLSALFLSHNPENGKVFDKTYACIFMLSLFFLILTKSRMTFGATLAAITTYCLITLSRPVKIALVLTAVIAGCLIYFGSEQVSRYSVDLISFGRGRDGAESVSTLTGRIPLWEECLRFATGNPCCGFGYNAFLSSKFLLKIRGAGGWTGSPHSGYIGTLIELGAVGILTLLLTIGAAIRESLRYSSVSIEYTFPLCVLVWLSMNLLLESFLITSPFFSTFLVLVVISKLAFTHRFKSARILP